MVTMVSNQKSEIRCQRSEVLIMNEAGLLIIAPSILPTSLFSAVNFLCSSTLIYPQSLAKSNDESVSLFSPSQSVSLLMKCASYRLFAQASRTLRHTDLEERRI